MRVHDDVRTDSRVTEGHVLLRNDQSTHTCYRQNSQYYSQIPSMHVIIKVRRIKLAARNVNATLLEQTFPIKLNWFLSDFSHMRKCEVCVTHLVQWHIKRTYSGLLKWNHWKFRLQDRVKVVSESVNVCRRAPHSSRSQSKHIIGPFASDKREKNRGRKWGEVLSWTVRRGLYTHSFPFTIERTKQGSTEESNTFKCERKKIWALEKFGSQKHES